MSHVIVVGGGLIGLGAAHAMQRMIRGIRVSVWEKEPVLGAHQSTHNSGVLHAGLYYAPGSSKARLAVRGIRLMKAFAQEHGVKHETCGKLVAATTAAELPELQRLLERGRANGLRHVEWLDAARARELEPNVNAVAGVRVPDEGIIDYAGVVAAMRASIERDGGAIRTGTPLRKATRVAGVAGGGRGWRLRSTDAEEEASLVVNCAGLQSDRVARLMGENPRISIVPFRGEYYTLARRELVRHLIYPVPDPRMPFLGVHFTRMIGGGVECGPNAVLALHREGYRSAAFRPRDAIDAVVSPRVWRFVARYPGMVWFELRRSLSKSVFLKSLQRLVPAVEASDLLPGQCGVRAQAMAPNGQLVNDFEFIEAPAALHVLNAPSPGATASLAIGEEIARRVATIGSFPLAAGSLAPDLAAR